VMAGINIGLKDHSLVNIVIDTNCFTP